jgi:hypothetical protein
MRRALLNCCALLDGLGVAAWLGFLASCKEHPAAAVTLFFAGLGLHAAAAALSDHLFKKQ